MLTACALGLSLDSMGSVRVRTYDDALLAIFEKDADHSDCK